LENYSQKTCHYYFPLMAFLLPVGRAREVVAGPLGGQFSPSQASQEPC
jgi:hypothetical protein